MRREKLEEDKEHGQQYNYRVIFRTSEVRYSVRPAWNLSVTSCYSCLLWKNMPTAFHQFGKQITLLVCEASFFGFRVLYMHHRPYITI